MISLLRGTILDINNDSIILFTNGIGYHIFVGNRFLQSVQMEQELTLHTYLHVREDAMQLYGMRTKDELRVFRQLISVSGIGPRTALHVLEAAPIPDLRQAVIVEDHALLTSVPGIGAKTAKRLVLELKNVFEKEGYEVRETDRVSATNQATVLSALLQLGYHQEEARSVLRELDQSLNEQEAIKQALKKLAG